MKLEFRGWKRQVTSHSHTVVPVIKAGTAYRPTPAGPLAFSSSRKAFGKVTGVGLTGDFLVELQFDDAELRSWLERYVAEQPELALPLLAEMHAKAILSLHRRPHKAADSDAE